MAAARHGTHWALAGLLTLLAGGGLRAVDPPRPTNVTPPALPTPSIPVSVPVPAPGPLRPTPDIPPLGLTTFAQIDGLATGKTVSVPLQAVTMPEPLSPPELHTGYLPAVGAPVHDGNPIANSWLTGEAVLWWPKGAPLPPLVTASRGAAPPRFGGPNTTLLVGGAADSPESVGGRFGYGFSVNEQGTAGLGATYFFLGTRVRRELFGDAPGRTFGRPVIDPATGAETVLPVSAPGGPRGSVGVATSTRAMGWEANGLFNLVNGPQARINAVVGYRYFQVNEGLAVTQLAVVPGGSMNVADQFDTRNRFHGAQLGLTADVVHGGLFLELTGKIALGQSTGLVAVRGLTTGPGGALPVGVLAQATNSGHFNQSSLAVLPEGTVRLGFRFENRSRIYVGYNLLYLSEAVRPGEQIDRAVDVANLTHFGTGVAVASDRPSLPFLRSDFWVQGVVIGLEYRY